MSINGGAEENWPRVGLEAMSAGVPVIADSSWGWIEMIQHGKTGFLADDHKRHAVYAAQLATDEALRLEISENARSRLVNVLANPEMIWSRWKELFEYVETQSAHNHTHFNKRCSSPSITQTDDI